MGFPNGSFCNQPHHRNVKKLRPSGVAHIGEEHFWHPRHNFPKSSFPSLFSYDRGGTPLWISAHNQPESIPKCEECGGDRQFEFQIMPQLLNYLGSSDVMKDLDWGVLSVFTCKNSCILKSGYCSEFIWKQDIVTSKHLPQNSS